MAWINTARQSCISGSTNEDPTTRFRKKTASKPRWKKFHVAVGIIAFGANGPIWASLIASPGRIALSSWTVPISPAFRIVLDELRAEQKKIASISNRVFTRNGRPMKSIRKAFEVALRKAKIVDLRLHDFRHTCITRWAAEGVPQQAIMAAAGHHSIAQNNDYVNMKDGHLRAAFRNYTPVIQANPVDNAAAVSY